MGDILPLLLGGLALFLYAISKLSSVMKAIFNDRAKSVIEKYTSNIFSSILIGTILTILLDSSSAVIILVIVFINAKALTFKNAIGLIMGANIGTTFSSQIIAMDVGRYAVIPLFIGLLLHVVSKSEKWKNAGNVLLYFGMLFFGLFIMQESVVPLKGSSMFEEWISHVEDNPYKGSLIGGLITLIIQSSSGTVGMAIVLGKEELLSISGGVAIMLGAELGTCSDTLLATINSTRQALKAGLFHLFFSLTTMIAGLLMFEPFMDLVEYVSAGADIGRTIANAHVMFNVLGVMLFLPFVSLIERSMNRLIKEKMD